MISGRTRIAGVIGDPVRHSLSPTIHNAAFAASGLDWVFLAFTVPEGAAGLAVGGMRALGIEGLSVTMPHKGAVIDALDELDEDAAALGAVNCISLGGHGLVGSNTDGAGFLDALRVDEGFDPSGRRCLVVGAGGRGTGSCPGSGAGGRDPGPGSQPVTRPCRAGRRAGRSCGPARLDRCR